jgi:hypothetical protein
VLVSAHAPGLACAGCVHPRDKDIASDIPTISFVSFWAGLIQALELATTAGRSRVDQDDSRLAVRPGKPAAGARIVEDLHQITYGERQYGARDLDGHHWLFSG